MLKEKVFARNLKAAKGFALVRDSNKGLKAGLVTLSPQELIGEHKTENKEEVLIILKGSAIIYFGKTKSLRHVKIPSYSFRQKLCIT